MWLHGDWMIDHGWWGWFMPFGGFWFLILLVVLFIVLFSRSPHRRPPRPSALDTLEERYAKGEIGRDEYLQKKRDILGQG